MRSLLIVTCLFSSLLGAVMVGLSVAEGWLGMVLPILVALGVMSFIAAWLSRAPPEHVGRTWRTAALGLLVGLLAGADASAGQAQGGLFTLISAPIGLIVGVLVGILVRRDVPEKPVTDLRE